jgi:UDP-glucose 4-epimerase
LVRCDREPRRRGSNPDRSMNVLVTGGAGFLGSNVIRAFADRASVIAVCGSSSVVDRPEVESWIPGPITSEVLGRVPFVPDVIVHCAGSSSVPRSIADPAGEFARTVPPLLALLSRMQDAWPQAHLIYPSSAAVYGNQMSQKIPENVQRLPTSPYGLFKVLSEDMIEYYSRSYGLKCSVIRFFSLYGIGLRKQILWDAAWKLLRGDGVFWGTGHEERDMLHVEDAISLIMKIVDLSKGGEILNAGTGRGVAVGSLLSRIQQYLGTCVPLVFKGEIRAGDPVRLVSDPRVSQEYGWQPRRELDESIQEYLLWLSSQQA